MIADKVPVVLLPGLGFCAQVWQPLQALLPAQFAAVPIDYPAANNSLIDWLSQFDRMLPEQAHYVGWSLGGLLAWKLAQLQPERVLSVATFASTPRFLATTDWPGVAQSDWFPFETRPEAVMKKRLLRLCLSSSPLEEAVLSRGLLRELQQLLSHRVWHLGLQALQTWDVRDWLAQTDIPSRCFFAIDDALLPSKALQARLPGSRLIAGSHAFVYTHPFVCWQQLEEFWHEL